MLYMCMNNHVHSAPYSKKEENREESHAIKPIEIRNNLKGLVKYLHVHVLYMYYCSLYLHVIYSNYTWGGGEGVHVFQFPLMLYLAVAVALLGEWHTVKV